MSRSGNFQMPTAKRRSFGFAEWGDGISSELITGRKVNLDRHNKPQRANFTFVLLFEMWLLAEANRLLQLLGKRVFQQPHAFTLRTPIVSVTGFSTLGGIALILLKVPSSSEKTI
jgi:hypothetical protein